MTLLDREDVMHFGSKNDGRSQQDHNVKGGVSLGDLFSFQPVEYAARPPELGLKVSGEWLRELTKPQTPGLHHPRSRTEGSITLGQPSLDKNTLKWKSWVTSGTAEEHGQNDLPPDSNHMYRLTQSEFKRLSEQVRDVSENLRNKFRSAAYKLATGTDSTAVSKQEVPARPYITCDGRDSPGILNQKLYIVCGSGTPPPDPSPPPTTTLISDPRIPLPAQRACSSGGGVGGGSQVYRSQLAASLKAFQHKSWVPYSLDQTAEACLPTRLRPATVSRDKRPASVKLPSKSSCPNSSSSSPVSRRRPKSTPPTLYHRFNYDSLTPEITTKLSRGQVPESVYGDRVSIPDQDELNGRTGANSGCPSLDGASGVSSSNDISSTSSVGTMQEADSDDSDDEDIPEPTLESVRMEKVPNLALRPEKVDSVYVPEPKGDRAKYDFDADRTGTPAYNFPSPFSEPFQSLNFREVALSERSWRDVVKPRKPANRTEERMLDRMFEMERLQKKSEEWEGMRKDRAKSAVRRGGRSSAQSRAVSAKSRDKRCCPECLQPACVGDCPLKKALPLEGNLCLICREKGCTGDCVQSAYNSRMRRERTPDPEEDKSRQQSKPVRSSVSASYQTKISGRLNNSYHVSSGRPSTSTRSTTLASTQLSIKPKELHSKGEIPIHNLEINLQQLELQPTTSPDNTRDRTYPDEGAGPQTGRQLRGRAALIPGKSYFSQRRNSLTDIPQEVVRAKTIVPKKRTRSAKAVPAGRRPKTAS